MTVSEACKILNLNNKKKITKDEINKATSNKVWDMTSDISFGNYQIKLNRLKKEGVYDNLSLKAPITLKKVNGNEKIMLNNTHHQDLKKIFQNRSIPLWEREKFILLYSHNELLLAYSDKEMFISSELR